MNEKKGLGSFLAGFTPGAMIGLFSLNAFLSARLADDTLVQRLFPVYLPRLDYIGGLPLMLLPIALLLLVGGGAMRDDLARSGVYRFTRQTSRWGWFIQNAVIAALRGLFCAAGYVMGVAGVACLAGNVNLSGELASLLLCDILLSALLYTSLLLIDNLLAIFYSVRIALCGAFGLIALCFVAALGTFDGDDGLLRFLCAVNPLCAGVVTWHDAGVLFPALALAGWNGVTLVVGWLAVRRCDIIAEMGE